MLKINLYLISGLLLFVGSAQALSDIDSFIRDHCGSACNGESDDCTQCYNEAIDLHDQQNPVSPEYNFDIVNKHGKLEWVF